MHFVKGKHEKISNRETKAQLPAIVWRLWVRSACPTIAVPPHKTMSTIEGRPKSYDKNKVQMSSINRITIPSLQLSCL